MIRNGNGYFIIALIIMNKITISSNVIGITRSELKLGYYWWYGDPV